MFKYKSKGITLLETVVAFSVFTILAFCAFSVEAAYIKQKAYNKDMKRYMECLEAAANTLVARNSYMDLKGFETEQQWYVNENNLKFEDLTSGRVTELMNKSISSDSAYMTIHISGADVLTVNLQIKFKVNGKVEALESEVYKGSYE